MLEQAMRWESGSRASGLLAAAGLLCAAVALTLSVRPVFAQDAPRPSAAEPTKQQILEGLDSLRVQLEALQKPPTPEAIGAGPSLEEKAVAERKAEIKGVEAKAESLLRELEDLKGPDTESLLVAPVERESGVTRLQRHQRELTTQKLGDQLIILDTVP